MASYSLVISHYIFNGVIDKQSLTSYMSNLYFVNDDIFTGKIIEYCEKMNDDVDKLLNRGYIYFALREINKIKLDNNIEKFNDISREEIDNITNKVNKMLLEKLNNSKEDDKDESDKLDSK